MLEIQPTFIQHLYYIQVACSTDLCADPHQPVPVVRPLVFIQRHRVTLGTK